jgi:RHS repeat-associated protein
VDNAGNRLSKTDNRTGIASSYTYDPAYELTKVLQGTTQKEAYTYDAVGNRTYQPGVPYTYNSSNEMTAREGVPYTYDANGNTLSKTNGSGTTSYTWDFENRLTSVTLPGTGGTVSFKYDPFGRRIQKTNPSGTTAYVYDGDNIVEELTGNTGTLSERYTYGPGIDEPLVGQRQPKIFYYEADGLGSVTSLTDPTGATAATYTYDSFGFMTASTGSATNWYRYTARQFDSDTGLYYYRARYYDPTIGRFLNEDPIRLRAGVNFYDYVQNKPLDSKDPSGLCPPQNPCQTTSTFHVAGADVKAQIEQGLGFAVTEVQFAASGDVNGFNIVIGPQGINYSGVTFQAGSSLNASFNGQQLSISAIGGSMTLSQPGSSLGARVGRLIFQGGAITSLSGNATAHGIPIPWSSNNVMNRLNQNPAVISGLTSIQDFLGKCASTQ